MLGDIPVKPDLRRRESTTHTSISPKCSPLFIMKNLSTAMVKDNSITSFYLFFKL